MSYSHAVSMTAVVTRSINYGVDAHVDAGEPLPVAHIRRASLRMRAVHRVAVMSGRGRRGDGGAVAGGEPAGAGGVIGAVRVAAESHGMHGTAVTATVTAARVRARRCRLGAAVRGVEVIYWSQTNA